MRSSALRLTLGAAAWIALGVAGFLVFQSEKEILVESAQLRAFDQHAHDASDALADLRVSQQAYVAAGQGVAFWMPKVATITGTVASTIDALRESASPGARTALDEATATMAEFSDVDKRARDYLKSSQTLMAADVIFTEGGDAAANAARQVETARLAEHQAQDVAAAASRKQEAIILAAAGGIAALVALALIPTGRGTEAAVAGESTALSLPAPEIAAPASTPATAASTSAAAPPAGAAATLKAAADLATDFGRLRDASDLTQLLARAADMMDASGVIVWLGNTSGADLQPVLAHGYSAQVLARIAPVPHSGNNAAAAAYRSSTLQIVLSRPGGASGAVVAPILAPDGCIGALSAEIRGGGETSDSVQALAAIFASHLAGLLAVAPTAASEDPKAAAAQG
jgi:hypothetical protein